jgi:Ni/Fe-hydrogenase subunit HybB-like protein
MGIVVRWFQVIARLLNIACGRSRRLQLAIAAMLLSLLFALVWGVAVGVRAPGLALANAYKVPVIIFLSSMFAVPAGLLTWKLSGAECSATDLLLGFATGVFAGTLVLAVLAPIVALYYESSWWAGPVLAQLAIVAALATGGAVLVRSVVKRARGPKRSLTLSLVVLKAMQIAALLQLIALFSPILPEHTHADRGIDGLAHVLERP